MSNWLSKAANVFKREVPEEVQPFDIACDCGQRHTGLRRQVHQHLVCKACGTSLFVLPRDVYPAPQPVPQKPAAVARPALDEDEIPLGLPVASAPPAAPAPKRKRRKAEISDPAALPAPIPARPASAKARASDPKVTSKKPIPKREGIEPPVQGRFWTPFRIVSAIVLVVIFFTTGWTVRQSLLSQAARVAQQEGDLGLAAVKQQEWLQARAHLESATAALDRLRRTDPEAETVRQYYRETRALTRPCTVPITELVEKARADYDSRDEKKRSPRHLVPAYRGEWLIIEGSVRALPTEEANGRRDAYALSLPWSPAGTTDRVLVRADFPVFGKEMSPGDERFAIFAGAIDECAWDEKGRAWVVHLEPETGFLWTHPDTYLAAGFEFTPLRTAATVTEQLRQQADLMGGTP